MKSATSPPAPQHIPAAALAGPTLRTLFNILAAWQVDDTQAQHLLGVPRSTYYRWRQAPELARLSPDTLERASYVFGIYKALQILLPNPDAADSWPRRPNDAPLFGGQPPLERMCAGHVADLYVVRQYLDAVRGGKT